MSYDPRSLFQQVHARLAARPLVPIHDIARELNVGRRTIEKTIRWFTGASSRGLRAELVLERVRELTRPEAPLLSIKEMSYAVGYQSSRSFARAIRRTCGCTPCELRQRATEQAGVLSAAAVSTTSPADSVLDGVRAVG